MLKQIDWAEERTYNTDTESEPIEFYTRALCASRNFDLLLGYFSSAAINVLSLGFAKFISTGGKLRMIINDVLSEKDKDVIIKVSEGYIYQLPFDIENFAELKSRLDDYDLHFFNCMGWLIQNDRIELKIIRPKNKRGISHYKSGVFTDGVEKIGFKGSCNFTYYGLLENLEEVVGLYKSVCLINRINRFFGTNWKADTREFASTNIRRLPEYGRANIYITCVDSSKARFDISDAIQNLDSRSYVSQRPIYWMDLGNGRYTGQVVLSTVGTVRQPSSEKYMPVGCLPKVTEEYKDILEAQPDNNEPSCSHADALEKQDLYINAALAQMGGSLCFSYSGKGWCSIGDFS